MSVINQVLNQLEQRGAHTTPEQSTVRAVPQTKRNITMPLLVFGLALIAGVAAWQWVQLRKPVLSSAEGPNVATVSIVPKTPQGFSHPEGTGNPPGSDELEKLTPLHKAVVAASAPVPAVTAENRPNRVTTPGLQLSFELSSVPLPSVSRSEKSDFAANTVESGARVAAPPVRSRSKKAAPQKTKVAVHASSGESPMKQVSPAQRADAEYRKAVSLMQQGRIADALAGYEAALRLDAGHDAARQALVALLLENKRGAEAERVLQDRLKSKPEHTGFTMLLARLQVDRGAVGEATATLEKSLAFASSQADYHAFLAALLQRQNRNEEAITHYQIVTQLSPGNGVWLMGYGISLQALQRNADAKEAFKKALDTQTLSQDLQAFVQQKLKEL